MEGNSGGGGIGVVIFIVLALAVVFMVILMKSRGKTFTYTEAMRYFKNCQRRNPAIVKGSLIRQRVDGGKYRIIQSCLDKDGKVVDGSQLTTAKLDNELSALFEKNNVVIVE
jgi:uncharacterized membrane protein